MKFIQTLCSIKSSKIHNHILKIAEYPQIVGVLRSPKRMEG